MNRQELEASVRILVAVARADGDVAVVEEGALAILHAEASATAREGFDLEREAARLESAQSRRATFEAALALASVDGRCSPEEHALLQRLRDALGIQDAPPLEVAEAAWLAAMEQPLARLAGLERDFLHALAGQAAGLSDDAYRALVSELRARRSSVLSAALAGLAL